MEELTLDYIAGAWRFGSSEYTLPDGQSTVLNTRGGETHTFTRVDKCGRGFVPLLNELSGNRTPAPSACSRRAILSFLRRVSKMYPVRLQDLPPYQQEFRDFNVVSILGGVPRRSKRRRNGCNPTPVKTLYAAPQFRPPINSASGCLQVCGSLCGRRSLGPFSTFCGLQNCYMIPAVLDAMKFSSVERLTLVWKPP